jgi:pimeloyl-ACP methyl ester carboxylesterase
MLADMRAAPNHALSGSAKCALPSAGACLPPPIGAPAFASKTFCALLDESLSEINLREPNYFDLFPVAFPNVDVRVETYSKQPLFRLCSKAAIEAALRYGFEYFRARGLKTEEAEDEEDPVGGVLCDSIVDAFAADLGLLDLATPCLSSGKRAATGYFLKQSKGGQRYLIRCAGNQPLLLINACGMSASLWSRLMSDHSHPWRTIVTESPCADLVAGGMRRAADLRADSTAIANALDNAGIDRTDVLAWCSGGRIAIDFAGQFPDRVRSLILICPTVRGISGVEASGSAFEDDLNRIFGAIQKRPYLAATFSKAFQSRFEFTAWDKFANEPKARAGVLFGLPARKRVPMLTAPMTECDFLVNYSCRVLLDQAHPLHDSLRALTTPVILVVGDYDNRVNNEFTRAALRAWGVTFVQVMVKGAGHYLYDLQYPYLRSILSAVLSKRQPARSARVEVEYFAD